MSFGFVSKLFPALLPAGTGRGSIFFLSVDFLFQLGAGLAEEFLDLGIFAFIISEGDRFSELSRRREEEICAKQACHNAIENGKHLLLECSTVQLQRLGRYVHACPSDEIHEFAAIYEVDAFATRELYGRWAVIASGYHNSFGEVFVHHGAEQIPHVGRADSPLISLHLDDVATSQNRSGVDRADIDPTVAGSDGSFRSHPHMPQ